MLLAKRPMGTVAYLGGLGFTFERFTFAWGQLIEYNSHFLCDSNTRIHYDRSRVSYHVKARNELVQTMLGDWILLLDADHEPEPDLLGRMLRVANKYNLDVLVGTYQIKVWPYAPLIYVWNEDHTGFELVAEWETNSEVLEIGAAGGGCLFIRRKVLYRIVTELHELPFDVLPPFSEDLSFFARLPKIDVKPYWCPYIENPHLYIDTIRMEHKDTATVARERKEVEGLLKI